MACSSRRWENLGCYLSASAQAGVESQAMPLLCCWPQMDAAQAARAAADAALEACCSELAAATAKAAAAADDAAKWQGTVAALEAQLGAASEAAAAAKKEAAAAREELAAKDGRIAEMRCVRVCGLLAAQLQQRRLSFGMHFWHAA